MYKYEEQKAKIFTDKGQRLFLQIRDRAFYLLKIAGAARLQEILSESTGDSWVQLACVERMVELGELKDITPSDSTIATQYRVFIRNHA